MGRAPARAVFGGMAGLEAESDTAIVEEYPRLACHQVCAEVEGVGLGERDAQTFAVDGAEVGGITVGQRGAGPACALRPCR